MISKRGEINWSKMLLYLLVVCNLIVMVYLCWYVYNYKTLIESDPLSYGAKVHNVDTCSCTSLDGVDFYFNSTTVWRVSGNKKQSGMVYNYTLPDNLFQGAKNGSV